MPRTGACIWSDRMGLGRTNESLRTALWSDKGFISPTKYMNWSIGVLEYWSIGVLEYWSIGVLECWGIGVLAMDWTVRGGCSP
jgi:hypothetical protein